MIQSPDIWCVSGASFRKICYNKYLHIITGGQLLPLFSQRKVRGKRTGSTRIPLIYICHLSKLWIQEMWMKKCHIYGHKTKLPVG